MKRPDDVNVPPAGGTVNQQAIAAVGAFIDQHGIKPTELWVGQWTLTQMFWERDSMMVPNRFSGDESHWMGLEICHALAPYELRVSL